MRKIYLPVALLMIAVMLGGMGCAPSELKPCTVELGYVSNEWQGSETIAANAFLTIKNPNSVPVLLESVDYTLNASDSFLGTKTLAPGALIPANGSVNINATSIIDYVGTLVTPLVLNKALDSGTAAVAALPLWKLLGGKTPPLWATGVAGAIAKAPADADISAAKTDLTKAEAVVNSLLLIKGTFSKTVAAATGTWDKAPAGPCVYKVKGKATISYGTLSKTTVFDLSYERK